MKEIKLSNSDKVALVDDEDYQHVISFGSWHFNNSGYAKVAGNIYLHRFVINYFGNQQVDHINFNKLDCRKNNLQILSAADNQTKNIYYNAFNSGYRGVKISKKRVKNLKYLASISINGRQINSRVFDSAFKAAVEAQNFYTIHRPYVEVDNIFLEGRGFLGI